MTRSLRCSDPNLLSVFLSIFGIDAKWLSRVRMLCVLGTYPRCFNMCAFRKSCAACSASKHAMSYNLLSMLPSADLMNIFDFLRRMFTDSSELMAITRLS